MFTHAQNWNIGSSYVAEAETMSSYLAFYEVICLSHLPSVSNFYSTLEIYNMPLDFSLQKVCEKTFSHAQLSNH